MGEDAVYVAEVLVIWHAEHMVALELALGAEVRVVEVNPGTDYGALPGPPAKYVLRAELRDAVIVSVMRWSLPIGLPINPVGPSRSREGRAAGATGGTDNPPVKLSTTAQSSGPHCVEPDGISEPADRAGGDLSVLRLPEPGLGVVRVLPPLDGGPRRAGCP